MVFVVSILLTRWPLRAAMPYARPTGGCSFWFGMDRSILLAFVNFGFSVIKVMNDLPIDLEFVRELIEEEINPC